MYVFIHVPKTSVLHNYIFFKKIIYILYSNIVLGSRREATGLGIPIYINMYVSKKETYIYVFLYIYKYSLVYTHNIFIFRY